MELSREAQALSQCRQQRIQAQVPRTPCGDAGRSAPAERPTTCRPPPLSCTHPEWGGQGACSVPAGLLVRKSLVRMYLPYCVPCPHSPLSQVPSRCTTEPSSSLSVSLGPSSRLHLQGMEWAGGHRWDCRQHLTCTPLCVSINLTHHCLPSSPRVSASSRFPGPSVLAHLQPHRYVPSPTTPP